MEKGKRRICIFLFLIAILLILTTGCETNDFKAGTITENDTTITYKESETPTNYVKILTNKNKIIIIELYPEVAPITVENFKKLVSEKFYDGLTFHRVIENFMIQTGDPLGNGTGGSDTTIIGEFQKNNVENNLKHEKGVVSMARSNDYNSASSQFFICSDTNESVSALDGSYAAFGRVIIGLDTVEEISKVQTDSNDKPKSTQSMKTVRFVTINEN